MKFKKSIDRRCDISVIPMLTAVHDKLSKAQDLLLNGKQIII